MAHMVFDGKPQPDKLARLQEAIKGKGVSGIAEVDAWDLRWALIRLRALEEFQAQVLGLQDHWSVEGGQSYLERDLAQNAEIETVSYVPVKVGYGKAIHVARVIRNENDASVHVLCGANRCTTGHRARSSVHTMKGHRITCKRCIQRLDKHPHAIHFVRWSNDNAKD